jgi:hypothetical protein
MAGLANSGGALAMMSRQQARVRSGQYYSPVELRGLSTRMVEAILGKNRTHLLTLMTENEAWAFQTKRSKEAKVVSEGGASAGFDPNHDPFTDFHRFSFTQPLELGGHIDPQKMSTLLYSTTIFYQDVDADITTSSDFQALLTKATKSSAGLKIDIARVRAAGGSLSGTITESIHSLMASFFTLRASALGKLSKGLPVNFAFRTQGLMVCWCFQKLSDDLKDFLKSLREAIASEAQSKEIAGESGDRYSAEA